MKILKSNQGMILATAVVTMSVLAIFAGVAFTFATQQGRMARRTANWNRAVDIADSELDRLYDQWRNLSESKMVVPPTDAELATMSAVPNSIGAVLPGLGGVHGTFLSSYKGSPSHVITPVDAFGDPLPPNANGAYTGPLMGLKELYSVNHSYVARVAVQLDTPGEPVEVEVSRTFTRSDTPVFQSAIFYNGDLELHPGASMTIDGPVISNRHVVLTVLKGYQLLLKSIVSANNNPDAVIAGEVANPVYLGAIPYHYYIPALGGFDPYAYDYPTYANSEQAQARLSDRLEPAGQNMREAFDTSDSNPNNDGYRELIERPDPSAVDPTQIASYRLYNQSNLRLSVVRNGPNIGVDGTYKDGNPVDVKVMQKVRQAFAAGRSQVYDKREGANVQVSKIDVAKLGAAIDEMNKASNPNQRFNGVVYLSDDTGDTGRTAFRLENADQLPTAARPVNSPPDERGFTVATDRGVYVKGNFNSDSVFPMVPAAIMGDAVTILSDNWQDSRSGNPISGMDDASGNPIPNTDRKAKPTTVKAAIMTGNIPAGYDPDNDPKTSNSYGASGGAHNFPRLLEDWKGVNLNFTGSMVQLFTSKMFTGQWQTGDVYSPPIRNWSYNADFAQHPSPGLFSFSAYYRGTWSRR